jgi:hypothetical protein
MQNAQAAPPRNIQLDHFIYYTVDSAVQSGSTAQQAQALNPADARFALIIAAAFNPQGSNREA